MHRPRHPRAGGIRIRLVLLLALVVLILGRTADAHHCSTWTTREAEQDLNPTGVGPRYYIDHDDCDSRCMMSMWVYEESNGVDGLQRGDEVEDDTCHGMIAPDTLIL